MEQDSNHKPIGQDISTTKIAADIRDAHAAFEATAKKALTYAIDAGKLLIQAKTLVGHGGWLTWLKDNCDLSERTAQAYMRVARHEHELEAKAQGSADLSLAKSLSLLAEPKAAPVDTFTETQAALATIRDEKLYRGTHDTFEGYALDKFGITADVLDTAMSATTITGDLLPPAGKYTLLNTGGDIALIVPSIHDGFYHVANIVRDVVGSATVTGTKKAIRGDYVRHLLDKCFIDVEPEYSDADELSGPIPWDYNAMLFYSKQEHIDHVILGVGR